MKKLSLSLISAALFLAPSLALAAYQTPGELIRAIQAGSARGFQVMAHGEADQSFVSVWMNGASEGNTTESTNVRTNATIDIVRGGSKMRAKGEMRVTDGSLYLHLDSLSGPLAKPFSSLIKDEWATLPFTREMATEMTNGFAFDLGSFDPAVADELFTLKQTQNNGVDTYTLTLLPDLAPELGQKIREMLADTQPVSDDIFPWKALADGTKFTLTVKMAGDRFQGSTLLLTLKTKHASFKATATETALASGVAVTAPTNVVSFEDIAGALATWIAAPIGSAIDEAMPQWTPPAKDENIPAEDFVPPGTTFDSVEPLSCSATSETEMVMLQRVGACPVTRTSTREAMYRWTKSH
jgi:hypothetical protein